MEIKDQLLHALAEFEAAIQESYSLADSDFDAKRRRGVELRRLISEKREEVGRLGERWVAGTSNVGAFREEFAKMRSAMAEHHATWPLVRIDLSDPQFRESSQASREATYRFMEWIRRTLPQSA